MPPPDHPLVQYREFVSSDSFHPFWKGTWGKPLEEVFDSFLDKGITYQVLMNLPPMESNPEFNSYPSEVEGLLMFSEYEALWTDLQNELKGEVTGLPTKARSDPSPWDHWNELEGKSWSDGFYRNEDGSPVVDHLDLQSQSQSNNHASQNNEAIEALKRRKRQKRDTTYHATFRVFQILGQPGIGKSMSLYFILARRLMAQKPTFLQSKQNVAFFFCSTGAYEVKLNDQPDPTWAQKLTEEDLFLFDSNEEVTKPADFWRRFRVPIVVAASPKSDRTQWARKMAVRKWYMRPMSLNEFLVASQFQSQETDQARLESFYTMYGPNARQAYHMCSLPDGLTKHKQDVRFTLRNENLQKIITESSMAESNHDSVSHFVMLITAGPTRDSFRSGFISRHVFQLAREEYEKDKNRRIMDLFRILNSQPETRASAGYMFEDSMHRILKKGICLPLCTMCDTNKGKKNRIYVTGDSAGCLLVGPTIQLSSDPAPTRPFPSRLYDHTDALYSGVYGQPKSPNNATFGAYFWNGPQKIVWMLQFSVSEEHDVKPSGVQWIKGKIPDDVHIRFVVFSPQDHVRLIVPKETSEIAYIYHAYIPDLEDLDEGRSRKL